MWWKNGYVLQHRSWAFCPLCQISVPKDCFVTTYQVLYFQCLYLCILQAKDIKVETPIVWWKDISCLAEPLFFAFNLSSLFLNFLKIKNIAILIIMIANMPTVGAVIMYSAIIKFEVEWSRKLWNEVQALPSGSSVGSYCQNFQFPNEKRTSKT